MMKKFLIILLLTLLVVPFSVSALVTYSGNHISINEPVNDDIFATGSIIEVNAPVQSIVAARRYDYDQRSGQGRCRCCRRNALP